MKHNRLLLLFTLITGFTLTTLSAMKKLLTTHDEACPICLDSLVNTPPIFMLLPKGTPHVIRLECTHAFHTKCFVALMLSPESPQYCPVCRTEACAQEAFNQLEKNVRTLDQAMLENDLRAMGTMLEKVKKNLMQNIQSLPEKLSQAEKEALLTKEFNDLMISILSNLNKNIAREVYSRNARNVEALVNALYFFLDHHYINHANIISFFNHQDSSDMTVLIKATDLPEALEIILNFFYISLERHHLTPNDIANFFNHQDQNGSTFLMLSADRPENLEIIFDFFDATLNLHHLTPNDIISFFNHQNRAGLTILFHISALSTPRELKNVIGFFRLTLKKQYLTPSDIVSILNYQNKRGMTAIDYADNDYKKELLTKALEKAITLTK